jgi:ribosomal protein S18 acetylase RimI-like enzyme
MPNPLADLGPQLANIRSFWLGYGAQDRCDNEMVLYRSGIQDSELNGVLRLPHGDPSGPLREAARRLAGVPWQIWAGPDSDPGLAGDLLAAGAAELHAPPVMAIRLDQAGLVDGGGPGPVPSPQPGVEIAELAVPDGEGEGDGDGLAGWVDCYGTSFGIPPEALSAQLAVERGRPDPPGTLIRFAARAGGTLAGTAALHARHGVAGLYVITVRPEFRRLGIGTALTNAALAAARDRGLPLATLHATAGGEPVYRRMGFTEVGRYRHFSPPPSWG